MSVVVVGCAATPAAQSEEGEGVKPLATHSSVTDPAIAFTVFPPLEEGGPLQLGVSVEKAATVELVSERIAFGGTPKVCAMASFTRDDEEDNEVLYLVVAESRDFGGMALLEVEASTGDSAALKQGREFVLPLKMPVSDVRIRIDEDNKRLYLHMNRELSARDEPVVIIYDIGSDAPSTNPIDIKMVPQP